MRTCIVVPTFNEAENLPDLLREIRRVVPGAHVLVVDDDSPDGTAALAEQAARSDPRVHLLRRTGERGRGSAGRAGFRWALDRGAERIVEMDADFSHHPRHLPALLAASERAGVVLGSRYVAGGSEVGRSRVRRWVSALAGRLLRQLLASGVADPTSGFRCFRRGVLEAVDVDRLLSTGPSIITELLHQARLKGFSIVEVPICFEDRRAGQSKLGPALLLQTLAMVLRLRWRLARGTR